jgi:hypothetical protein
MQNTLDDVASTIYQSLGLGADEVIDYKSAEWSEALAGQDYDMVGTAGSCSPHHQRIPSSRFCSYTASCAKSQQAFRTSFYGVE